MRRDLRNAFLTILIVLVVQFVLGMAVNLFVKVPLNHPGANSSEYFSGVAQSVTWAILQGPFLLVLHTSLGVLLVLVSLGILVRAIQSRSRAMIITATIGALTVLAAGLNGGSYLNYHEDFSSMLMASSFAIAVTAYVVGLWQSPLPRESPTPDARSPAPPSAQSL